LDPHDLNGLSGRALNAARRRILTRSQIAQDLRDSPSNRVMMCALAQVRGERQIDFEMPVLCTLIVHGAQRSDLLHA
jgi:hypothetical protein